MSYINEPHWQHYQKFRYHAFNKQLLNWLLDSSSLTARLQQHCKSFQVQVLTQHLGYIFLSERQQLAIPEMQWAYVREVNLICDGMPWVFARTIIPRETLNGIEKKLLLELGNTSLGQVLFQHRDMQRSNFELAAIKPMHYQFQRANTGSLNETTLYGRRSLFFLSNKPLLVSEIFTPYFPFYN